jgi:hypothetical protein
VRIQDVGDASTGVFLIGDSGEHDVALGTAAYRLTHRDERGGEAGLHVVRAAAVETVAIGARLDPSLTDADSVEVAAQKQSGRLGGCGSAGGDQQARSAGGGLEPFRIQPGLDRPTGDQIGDCCLADSTGSQRGVLGIDRDQGRQEVADLGIQGGHAGSLARRTTAFARRLVAFAQARGLEYSRGVWLIPPYSLATKTIAVGQIAAISRVSWPAPDMVWT